MLRALEIVLFSFFLGVATQAREEAVSIVQAPGGARFGLELEMGPQYFAQLTPYFDYSHAQTTVLAAQNSRFQLANFLDPPGVFDDYLLYRPEILESLPKELRKELTKGLVLKSRMETRPQELVTEKPAVATLGENVPSAEKPELFVPERQPITRPPPAGYQERGGVLLPEGLNDWPTLNKRWNALPEETKAKLVNWELLGQRQKADLATRLILASGVKHDYPDLKILPVKKDAPQEFQELMRRAYISMDNDMIEFHYREKIRITSPQQLWDDLAYLTKRTGTESRIFDPANSRLRGVNHHVHISVEGRDLSWFAERVNKRHLLLRLKEGILNDLTGGKVIYTNQIDQKGLVRLLPKDKSRVEIRDHRGLFSEELNRYLNLLKMNESAAIKDMDNELAQLLDNHAIGLILKHKPEVLVDLEDYLPPERKILVKQVSLGKRVARGWKESDADEVVEVLKSGSRKEKATILNHLASGYIPGKPPEAVMQALKEKLPDFLTHSDAEIRQHAFRILANKRLQLDASFDAHFLKMIERHKDRHSFGELLDAVLGQEGIAKRNPELIQKVLNHEMVKNNQHLVAMTWDALIRDDARSPVLENSLKNYAGRVEFFGLVSRARAGIVDELALYPCDADYARLIRGD